MGRVFVVPIVRCQKFSPHTEEDLGPGAGQKHFSGDALGRRLT